MPHSGPDNSVNYGEFWLIYSPTGAQPGTTQASTYVVFSRKADADGTSYCSYTTIPDWSGGTFTPPSYFPSHWVSKGTITISNWFLFPNDMAYTGSDMWGNNLVDRWDSVSTCRLFGGPPIPCTRLATLNQTSVPYAVQFGHQKKPNSFESDWLSVDLWTYFSTTDTNISSISPPEALWPSKCYNFENSLEVSPQRGYVSTASGMDNFTVNLPENARPVDGLDPVTIQFQTSGSTPSCVDFLLENGGSANGLQFTSSNWKTPVRIFLKYLNDGETYFTIVATGGGYDIPYILFPNQKGPEKNTKTGSLRAIACANGIVGYGC